MGPWKGALCLLINVASRCGNPCQLDKARSQDCHAYWQLFEMIFPVMPFDRMFQIIHKMVNTDHQRFQTTFRSSTKKAACVIAESLTVVSTVRMRYQVSRSFVFLWLSGSSAPTLPVPCWNLVRAWDGRERCFVPLDQCSEPLRKSMPVG